MSSEQRNDSAADIAALVAEARHWGGIYRRGIGSGVGPLLDRVADALEAVARERDRDAAMGTQTTVLSIFTGEFVRQAMEVPEYERETDSPNHVVRELYAALLTAEKERDAALARAEAAEAVRGSGMRERADAYRYALEQRMIRSNLPLLTGDADADLMRYVFYQQGLALSSDVGVIAELRARADAARAELARLGPVERVWLTNETRWQKIRRVLDPLLREGGAE
jgi:hypothetical protein